MDSKGGSWQVSGGHLQPTWLFRRKASPLVSLQIPFPVQIVAGTFLRLGEIFVIMIKTVRLFVFSSV